MNMKKIMLLIFIFQNVFKIDSTAQNVGIGITSPQSRLHISGDSSTELLIGRSKSAGGFTALYMGTSSVSNGRTYIQAVQSAGNSWGSLLLNPDGGNVGIGTSTPDTKLDVTGMVRITSALSIGSATPSYNLDVAGFARINYLGIGTPPNTTYTLDMTGDARINGDLFVNGNGIVTGYATDAGLKIGRFTFSSQVVNTIAPYSSAVIVYWTYSAYAFTEPPNVIIGNCVNQVNDWYKAIVIASDVTNTGCTILIYNPTPQTITISDAGWRVLLIGK